MTRVKLVDISKPHYATRRFTMSGNEYQQNEKVDLSELDQRTAQRLIKYRYVSDLAPKTEASVAVKAETPVVEPVVDTKPEVDANAKTGTLVHVGGGQYEVQGEDGENLLPEKVKGKDMAKMAASQFGIVIVE